MAIFQKKDSVSLSFDLEKLSKLKTITSEFGMDIAEQRESLKEGLEELRKDWRTPAGDYFFQQLDTEWETSIMKVEKTISLFEEIIENAIKEYTEVQEKAEALKLEEV